LEGALMLFRLIPRVEREQVQHDMRELYALRRQRSGRVGSALWLWWHSTWIVATYWRDRWRTGAIMRGVGLDVRHVMRGLRASRGFTAVAVLSLAIGIGANAAIFSVIRTLLLDGMAVPAPEQLRLVSWHHPAELKVGGMMSSGGTDPVTGLPMRSNYNFPMIESLRAATPAGVDLFAFNFLLNLNVSFDERPATLAGGLAAEPGYFSVMRPGLHIGRGITDADNRPDATPVVVLSYPMFMRIYGGDRSALGQVLRVNGVAAQIIGVTAPEFRGLSKGGFFPVTEVTVPLRLVPRIQPAWEQSAPLFSPQAPHWLRVMVRVTDPLAEASLQDRWAAALQPHIEALAPGEARPSKLFLHEGGRGLDQTSADTRRLLYVLMGVVGIVLLLASVNLASMMLARGASRQREWHVRRALGAGRWRLIRAQLVEGAILAVTGAAGGLLLTFWGRAMLTNLLTAGLGTAPMSRQPLEVSVDGWLIGGTLLLAGVVAVLFSLIPAWRLTRLATHDLRTRVVGAGSPRQAMGRSLVAVQIAMTVPLLVCAVLFLRTIANLSAIDLGFDPAGIAYFRVNPAPIADGLPAQSRVFERLLDEVRRVPGITAVTVMENALLSGIVSNSSVERNGERISLWINAVGPDFLDVVGLRLLAGRMPGLQDVPDRPRIGVVNQAAATALFGEQSPIGQTVTLGSTTFEIVGLVSDALYDRPRAGVRPTLYPSALQRGGFNGHFVTVRTTLPAAQVEPALRAAVARISRDLPVPEIKTQEQQVREMTMRERVFAQLLTIFGAFALLLACIGLHGVTAYSVAQRTNEIGVRMALGAQSGQVLWLVLRQVAVLAAIGLAAGIPLALWVAPLFSALLFKVTPGDPSGLAVGGIVMLAVALAAGFLPARRAARLDPLKALRTE
jgi:predicted permease